MSDPAADKLLELAEDAWDDIYKAIEHHGVDVAQVRKAFHDFKDEALRAIDLNGFNTWIIDVARKRGGGHNLPLGYVEAAKDGWIAAKSEGKKK